MQDLIDHGFGICLVQEDDDFFVCEGHDEEEGRFSASLLFAFHEGALHDWNGEEMSLSQSQRALVHRWMEERG